MVVVLGLVVVLPALGVIFAPDLSCDDPYVKEASPDGQFTITVCGRSMWFAMPGSGSDAPAWIVLRDETHSIRGVSNLGMLQLYGGAVSGNETEWKKNRVSRPMVFDLPMKAADGPFDRWLTDRWWRVRALVGAVPNDNELH
jgi:hypothetical protein